MLSTPARDASAFLLAREGAATTRAPLTFRVISRTNARHLISVAWCLRTSRTPGRSRALPWPRLRPDAQPHSAREEPGTPDPSAESDLFSSKFTRYRCQPGKTCSSVTTGILSSPSCSLLCRSAHNVFLR